MENTTGTASYSEQKDGIAWWLATSVAGAFFASLERCACVNVDAEGEEEEDFEEAHDRPLMLTSFSSFNSTTSSAAAISGVNVAPPAVQNLPV